MRVYRAKRRIVFTQPIFRPVEAGEIVYQEETGRLIEGLGLRRSYLLKHSYPVAADIVEDDPDSFERLPDSDKSADYFMQPIYAQEQMDEAIAEAYDKGMNAVNHSNY